MSTDCIFCAIARGDAPAHVVYEDDHALAFLDIAPVVPGHSLVVPRRHVEGLLDQGADTAYAAMGPALAATARLLAYRLGAEGINVLQSTGRPAGQVVFHIHCHVVPRYTGDGLLRLPPRSQSAAGELAATHARLVGG